MVLNICNLKKLIILHLTIALCWTGRQENSSLSSTVTQLQCSKLIFMLHISHLYSQKHQLQRILLGELLAWLICTWPLWRPGSSGNPRRHAAFGGREDEAHLQQKEIFLSTVISPNNSLPFSAWNWELFAVLFYFNSLQHTQRIRHAVPSTNENEYGPWSQNKSHSWLHYREAAHRVRWQSKLSHPPCIWVVEILMLSVLTVKTSLFQNDIFSL